MRVRAQGRIAATGAALLLATAPLPAPARASALGSASPAATVATAPIGASDARRKARAIVSQRRFQPAEVPQPLRRPLELASSALDGAIDWLADRMPGGRMTVWWLAALPVALGSATVVWILARRHRRAGVSGLAARAGAMAPGPAKLEREADDAERAGQLERALRLRFAAGLARLDRAGAITLAPSLTTGQVSRLLRSPAFDGLALAFEDVAYGGRAAALAQLEAARSDWPRVLDEVTR